MTQLLDYVLEQDKEIDPRGYRLQSHKGFIKARPDVAALPGVDFDVKVDGDHVWMRVARLEGAPPPAVGQAQWRGVITCADSPDGPAPWIDERGLKQRIAADAHSKPHEPFTDIDARWRDAAQAALAIYAPLWTAWAEGEKPRRKTIALYGDLFAIKHQLDAEETANPQELVWGLGVTAWQLDYAERTGTTKVDFQYPLLTQSIELALDATTLAIELRPRAVDPRFEFDAFAACSFPATPEVERAAREALARSGDRPITPFDPGSYEHYLKLIAGNLHEKGRFAPGQQSFPTPSADLVVTDAWVILARPRSKNYLHEDIERLKDRIAGGCDIPLGPMALVTPPSDEKLSFEPVRFRGLCGTTGTLGGGSDGGPIRELFFPLPYNHEQVTIVEQLERSQGVAVQGPPGTGKTHTIANIVCHFLATGRKVLVTSKGEQALEVLQSKIPKEVQPLTVALLAGDREGLRQFQASIEAIIHNVSQLNPDVVREQIGTLHSAIDRAHMELSAIDARVDTIAQTQLADVEVDGVPMRAQKMAELVVRGEEQHAWFDDALTLTPQHAPPLTSDEAANLRQARRRLGRDLVYVTNRVPASVGLLPAAEVGQLHQALTAMRAIEASEARGGLPALRAATREVLEEARLLLASIEEAMALAAELEESEEIWTETLRRKCVQPSFQAERAALEALFDEAAQLVQARAAFLKRPVEVPAEALGHAKVREALERGAQTGKPFGLLAFGAGAAKEYVEAIRVSGLAPAGAEDWGHVLQYANLHAKVLSFSVRWNEFAPLLSLPQVQGSVVALRAIEQVSILAKKAHRLATKFDARHPALAERVFAKQPVQHLKGTSGQLGEVREHLRSHLTRADLARAATSLATLQEKLAGTGGPASVALRQFIEEELGSSRFTEERIVARYAELVSEVRRVESLSNELSLVESLSTRVESAGGQRLAARLRTLAVGSSGDDAALPTAWRDAWNWARIKSHLDAIEARDELRTLAARRRDLEAGLSRLYEDLVSKSAWLQTKLGASPLVLSALETYRTAVRRIGQGTGPNATRHRRDAQRAMNNAQGAVPCWVMSHAKVSETLPSQLGCFDLVIVDEASQSDLWALPAVLRGKKILVVGDDKQVSPDGAFISAVRIQELKDRFLSDQPFSTVLTPEKSLYDVASTVFAAQKVMLREHFRCVPPIIAYSNKFYDGFIQPLRIPKASERLDPPLVDIHVAGGHRGVKDENRLEAQAIVEEIEALLADPRYAGRTIGVVSLLGPDQARHIDTLVRSRVDAMELMRRRFDCGDARLFQGSERDIMFLSMVADPTNCRALSGNTFEQRFNVAASRARDRMYLVRSVQLSDLSTADLRRGLLAHFTKPQDGSVGEVRSLVDECESGFERDVYMQLFQRGYRVIPQVKAGSFRIDMVVEGANDARLALECDGDEFHGPDRWAADMSRQRVLERAGWTFWRCFASTWAMRKEEVLRDLLDRLTAMGIEPLGAVERIPSLVEHRQWGVKPTRDEANDATVAALEAAIAAAK
ncbi:AAA domain-containing protein [Aquabacterium humicola]|uniref:AAA domain-containing protein n=1 Tax=Aquabacterium humicola TaxID=3237377 RepID=UPI002543B907|nr:AAA domain-containing protein [Rubrivivax pictus]